MITAGCKRYIRWPAICRATILAFHLGTLAAQPSFEVYLITDVQHAFYGSIAAAAPEDLTSVEAAERVFSVHTHRAKAELPSLLGRYHLTDGLVIFQPRFPLLQGRTYWVHLRPPNGSWTAIPTPVLTEPGIPQLSAIYPSDSIWPANQLKFYLQFDEPMRTGYAPGCIKLFGAEGREVAAPFLIMEQELWDASQQRLTVWFDPGRIKSYLIPNQKMGPPLLPDQEYELVICPEWPAANGRPLGKSYRKRFRTTVPDRSSPNPGAWQIEPPRAGTLAPLQVRFPEAMDHALLHSGLAVLDPQQQVMGGIIEVRETETSWLWRPTRPWQSGTYILRISTDVEDLAGNNLVRPFDRPYRPGHQVSIDRAYVDIKVVVQ